MKLVIGVFFGAPKVFSLVWLERAPLVLCHIKVGVSVVRGLLLTEHAFPERV